MQNSICDIRITNSKSRLIDLILALSVLILPFYSRLVIAVLLFWLPFRERHQDKDPDMPVVRCSSCISMDSGVDIQGSTFSSIYPEEFLCPPEGYLDPLASQNDEVTQVDPPSAAYDDSYPDLTVENIFHHHGSPDDFHNMDAFNTRERIAHGSDFIADLKTESETIHEHNEDISMFIYKANLILAEGQDGTLKSSRRDMVDEFMKLKEVSQLSRYRFKMSARRMYSMEEAQAVINENLSFITNHRLIKDAEDQLSHMDKILKQKGLDLSPSLTAKDAHIKYPIFDGESLPLINEFLREIESLLIQAGIPVSARGNILSRSVKGRAKFILRHSFIEKNPSWEDQKDVLMEHFGDSANQMLMIEKWHRKHGPIPGVNQSIASTHSTVSEHLTLIKAAKSLQADERNLDDPITSHYLDLLEGLLPRNKREMLCNERRHKRLITRERFKQIEDAFNKIQIFSSMEVIRGFESEANMEGQHQTQSKISHNFVGFPFPFDPSVPPPSHSHFLQW